MISRQVLLISLSTVLLYEPIGLPHFLCPCGNDSSFFCGRSAVLRPSVHMLPGIGWCGAGLPPFPTACWWLTHPAAITGVSVAARWDSPGGCGGPSVPLLVIMIIIIIMIMIALKAAIRDFFYNFLVAPRAVSNS